MILSHPFDPTAPPERLPADAPANGIIIPGGFQMVRRLPSQLLLQWPPQSAAIDANPHIIFSGLSWISAQVHSSNTTNYGNTGTSNGSSSGTATPSEYATIRFRLCSRVWPQLDEGMLANFHRVYARVCLYFAVRRLFPDMRMEHVQTSLPSQ